MVAPAKRSVLPAIPRGFSSIQTTVTVVLFLFVVGNGGGGSTEALKMVPGDVEGLVILNVAAVIANEADHPGDTDDFGDEILDEIESGFDTEEIRFEQITEFVILAHPSYGDEAILITGDFAFEDIRDGWDDLDFEDDSYRGIETWDGYNYYALIEDQGAIFVSYNEEFVKLLDDGSRSLAHPTDSDMKIIVDRLGAAPVVVAIASDFCDVVVSGCTALGAGYAGADLGRDEIITDLAVLFSSERRAERAFDDYDDTVELMEEVLDDLAEEADDVSGLPEAVGVDVDDLELDGLFITATGIIEVEEE